MPHPPGEAAIHAEGLVKHFGDVKAVDGLDLTVPYGTVYGLLGPNGAGKTTTVRILATLLKADAGSTTVAGIDVAAKPDAVRHEIGLTGQYAAVDEYLTGRENLDMIGRLYHLPKAYVKNRADELLERFSLTDAADRPAKTYSGGMRRRLDLSASLMGNPKILFLDEPTTGLDPRSRLQMWEVITDLVADGTTVLLTTQYLEEADQLAEQIVVIDKGRVIAKGTSDELKTQVGGDRLEIVVSPGTDLEAASGAVRAVSDGEVLVDADTRTLRSPVSGGSTVLVEAVRALDAAGVKVDDLALRRPTLDDVFLTLTGHAAEEEPAPSATATGRRRGRAKKEA
ncbi:ATP-binding cassette domain-containing protein [Longivirga aurantiaca]|uniref:ATP-binding cassette domain-containing protein n=1 Tax=Longivirga aurantiaca TaxID=1837743 RepID=A0ABW1SYK9_9ACTN